MDQTTTATAHAYAVTAVTVAGVTTGMTYETLLAGLAGAFVAVSYLEAKSVWRRAWSLFTSTLLASYMAPLVGHALSHWFPEEMRFACVMAAAFGLGVCAQSVVPAFMKLARRRVESYEGPTP